MGVVPPVVLLDWVPVTRWCWI